MLEVKNVTKSYSSHKALDDISLSVPEKGIYGLLGPNGAGKTTLIRIITHITAPDSGKIFFDGHELNRDDVRHIGYLPEERGLYKKMKVGEQALFFARLKGMSKNDATRELKKWFDKFEIGDWWNKKVEELSKGMAQKVQFITTVLHKPRLLIFDEPFSGFDPINANLLKNEIIELKKEGATIIFSTHNMGSVETLCDNITLINKSRNILSGNVEQIRREQGAGRFTMTFLGDTGNLLESLGDRLEHYRLVEKDKDDAGAATGIQIKIRPDVAFSEVIDIANKTVELESFTKALPSMDEIFINAVNQSNSLSHE